MIGYIVCSAYYKDIFIDILYGYSDWLALIPSFIDKRWYMFFIIHYLISSFYASVIPRCPAGYNI